MKQLIFIFLYLTLAHAEHNYSNALINEDSPYLQQHAHNPVNWYPWGEEAFEKAKRENKLIFVSIGYSTCHWCHVMEEESFTNLKVAKLLNDDFVSIKVDREAFPQLDQKYQKFYMAVHGERGGWPLSIFMSPDAEVFHLATYIPTEEAYGSIGLMKMLPSFVERQKHLQQFKQELASYRNIFLQGNKKEGLHQSNIRIIDKVVENIVKTFDVENGGFVKHPKFPEASKLALLLDIYALSGNKQAFDMAEFTLKKMAEGGIYDQVGGGFFRYTTDTQWQIPHFEKMLYTNAELISVYVKLYEITGDRLYKKVVDETIAQMEKNYRQDNLYLSASDADSDGEEGGYFIYAYVEMKKALKAKGWKPKEIEAALAYMGIEEDGNIDGDFSHTHITSQQIPVRLEALKTYLGEVSTGRTFPFVDKKINTAWNAMMVKALFEASRLDKKYLPLAEKRLNALLTLMYRDTVLYHQVLLKKSPRQKALLEDYAFLIDALLEGYARTYRQAYLSLAQKLSDEAVEKFYKKHRWYLSADGIEAYADFDDRYYTSALSLMLENLVRLSTLIEVVSYKKLAQETINASAAVLEENPENAAKLVHTFLRLKKGDIVIHAKKQKLLMVHSALDSIKYPFILSTVQESDEYLACKSTMCFAYDKNMTKLIDQINKAVK